MKNCWSEETDKRNVDNIIIIPLNLNKSKLSRLIYLSNSYVTWISGRLAYLCMGLGLKGKKRWIVSVNTIGVNQLQIFPDT